MQNNFINKVRILLIGILTLTIALLAYSAWGMPNKLNYILDSPPLEGLGEDIQHQVKGKVVDTNGMPIPGVHVLIKNTQQGTFTDNNGAFTITANPSDVLVISYIGFQTVETPVGVGTELTIVLEEDVTTLGEVTVNAGYYTVKEKERTGSISRITAADIETQPVANPLAALQGRMSGVFIQQNTGVLGGSFSIQIRGRNSIAAGNNPLYVIDGVPFSSDPLSASFSNPITGGGNPLENINPADIKSIEVLKDADATAIYGSRGANGVVLITTKKGLAGKIRFDLSLQSGTAVVSNTLPLLNTSDYLVMRNEAFTNDGITPTLSNAPDLLLWDNTRYTDWQKKLFGKTAFITQLQTSISGGSDQTHFRFGGNYRDEGSVFNGSFGYQKAGANLALNHHSANEKFNLSISASYQSLKNDQPLTDPTLFAISATPNAPEIYNEDGTLNWEENTFSNPFGHLLKHYKEQLNTLHSNAVLQYELIPGLSLKANLGYNHAQSSQKGITPMASLNPTYYNSGEAWFGDSRNKSWIAEPQLSYRKTFGKSSFKLLAGATFQENKREVQEFYAGGFTNDALIENIAAASILRVQNLLQTQYRYQALFGRVNYSYAEKYFLNLTGRRDGSSRFGPGKQWANFGAIGGAWLFSNEKWLLNNYVLSFGKLRASYGTTGNDQISDYGYLDSWRASNYTYGGNSVMYPARLYNPDYGWEVNKKFEIALELGFLKDRIMFSAAYYQNRSSSQLVGQPLPYTTGFVSIQNNLPAKVQNTGWEFELHTTNFKTPHFRWDTDILLTLPDNKLLAFPNLEESVYANRFVIDKSLYIVKTYHSLGVDPDTGLYTFEDVNGDGIVSAPYDLQTIKELGQDFYGSFRNSVHLGGWQLNFLFDFVKQTGRSYNYSIGSPPGYMSNQPEWVLQRWQAPGDQSNIQRFTQSGAGRQAYSLLKFSDRSITDASYIKLRNVSLSYTLPEKFLLKTPFSNCSFSLLGQNLFTITNYKGLDPETQTNNSLPPLRVFMGGINVSF